ncbi:MAG TPA: hypothetical protein VHR72_04580 [Gemmataceae bacterium]|nr:hypothetical protein [Gemmataceae bacterium]
MDDEIAIHRISGGSAGNLALKPIESTLIPPGISVQQGVTAAESAEAMRRQFPRMAPKGTTVVGSSTVGEIRKAGFDVIMDPTPRFPQHARLIHPDGVAGFTAENLERLAERFHDTAGL